MNTETLLPAVAAWLATYLIHSTVLLAITAIVTTNVRGEAWRDTLWKFALVGGVISATTQVALDIRPAGGRMSVTTEGTTALSTSASDATSPRSPAATQREVTSPAVSAVPSASTSRSASPSVSAPPSSSTSRSALPAAGGSVIDGLRGGVENGVVGASPAGGESIVVGASAPAGAENMDKTTLLRMLTLVWATIAVLLLLRLVYRHVRLFRMLSDRRQVVEGGLAEMLAELRRNAGIWRPVWLAASSRCPTPLALGASEICIPERFVGELQRDEQRAALAHELAHIARRDPLWHLIAGVIECVLFFQPLNRLARLRMRDAAEHLCDDWAVDHGGSQMGLARCLAAVASWIAPGSQPIPNGTMAMAEGGSPLLVRVQRLLQTRERGQAAPLAIRAVATLALLVALVALAPNIVTGSAAESEFRLATPTQPGAVLSVDDGKPAAAPPRATEPAPPPRNTTPPSARTAAAESVTVIRMEDEAGELFNRLSVEGAGSLQLKWNWARARAGLRDDRSYWIAWAVPSMMARDEGTLADSKGVNLRDLKLPPISTVLGIETDVNRVRGDGSAAVVMFKLWIPPNDIMQIERVAVRTAALGMRFGAPVYWLGTPDVSSSRQFLENLIPGIGRSELPQTIVAAIAVHRDTGVVTWLNKVIDNNRMMFLHLEAIEGLAWHPSTATLNRLADIARNGATPEMQKEAIESIGRIRHPGAGRVLRSLMSEVRDPSVRRQVAESMGSQPDSMLEALMEAAITDSNDGVRRQAAEAIGKLHPRDALVGLGQIIWNSNDPSVQVEAVEALGDVGTRAAFDLLVKVIERHEHPSVVLEAVETVGSMPSAWASPALIEVSRRHPLKEIRAKAMEELGDLERRSGDDRDVNPNPNYDGGNHDSGKLGSSKTKATRQSSKPASQIIHQ